jgi:hypothetical protein
MIHGRAPEETVLAPLPTAMPMRSENFMWQGRMGRTDSMNCTALQRQPAFKRSGRSGRTALFRRMCSRDEAPATGVLAGRGRHRERGDDVHRARVRRHVAKEPRWNGRPRS